LASALVIENLFHLLEKYKRLSPQLLSMLVKLIYQIIRVRRENIVIFFELSYFVRIQRIYADPLVRDRKSGKRYQEMVELLKFILRQFFKCAETNGCVFVELLFRKVPETSKDSLLESHTAEFAAILDNYENEEYARVLEKMRAGETLDALKTRQRALLEGTLPWAEEEDNILRTKFHIYAEHPLCAELLAAELPEESQRTGAKVRKRLIELGLLVSGQRGAGARSQAAAPRPDGNPQDSTASGAAADDPLEPPSKKPRLDVDGKGGDDAAASQFDETLLETDLERLLDAAMDEDSLSQLFMQADADVSMPAATSASDAPAPAGTNATATAATAAPSSGDAGPVGDGVGKGAEDCDMLDLETELEAQLDADLFEQEPPASGVAPEAAPTLPGSAAGPNLGDSQSAAHVSGSGHRSGGAEAAATPPSAVRAPAPGCSPTAGSEFDLERALESQLDKDLAAGDASQQSEGGFDLEQALASQLDKDPEFVPGFA